MPATIRPVVRADRLAWEPLWQGYLDFYGTALAPEVTDLTWDRLCGADATMSAFVAEDAGALTGFVHVVVHPTTWTTGPACYLEDLFVRSDQRGQGTGRALIEHLVAVARERGWSGIHWLTAHDNTVGMRLYDRLARRTSWVRYEIDLAG